MKKRLFLAIQLPDNMRCDLGNYRRMVNVYGASWTAVANLHVTVFFLGNVNEHLIENLSADIQSSVIAVQPFTLVPRYITFAPPDDPRRMIWLQFHGSQAFSDLTSICYHAIASYLDGQQIYDEERVVPHVTMARLSRSPEVGDGLPQLGLSELPVKSIDLVKSDLQDGGAVYTVLETFFFGGEVSKI